MAEKKSTQAIAKELQELVVDYGKQETVDPLKNLGRYLGAGIAGSVLVGTGIALLLLAVLRGLQAIGAGETALGHPGGTFNHDLSFVPYLIVAILAGLAVALLYRAINREPSSSFKESESR